MHRRDSVGLRKSFGLAWALLALSGLLTACGQRGYSGPETPAALPQSMPAAEFVVFSSQRLDVTKLEQPVALPVVLGSKPSPRTLVSDDPAIASVTADGQVIGHKAGHTFLRGRGAADAPLAVTVQPLTRIRITPGALTVPKGETRRLGLVGDGDVQLNVAQARWFSSEMSVAAVLDGVLHTGASPKTRSARVWAEYDGLKSEPVNVKIAGPIPVLAFAHPPSHVRVGEVKQLALADSTSFENLRWTSSNPSILKPVNSGFFWALARGSATLCARTTSNSVCTNVEVRK